LIHNLYLVGYDLTFGWNCLQSLPHKLETSPYSTSSAESPSHLTFDTILPSATWGRSVDNLKGRLLDKMKSRRGSEISSKKNLWAVNGLSVANCLGRYELGRNIKLDSAGYNNINCQEVFVTSGSLRCGDD